MLKKRAEFWSSLPPLYRRRFYQGIAVYLLLIAAAAALVWQKTPETVQDWNSRIPAAEAPVTTVYLTPQLTDTGKEDDFGNVALPPGSPVAHVALIMTDLGLATSATDRAIRDLPPEVALAFSPYAPDLKNWLELSHKDKKATLILLPMEPYSYPKDDPGPKALLTRYSDKENAASLAWVLDQAPDALGAMNFMGSKFLGDKKSILPVLKALHAGNKIFIESATGGLAQAQAAASATGIPYAAADVLVDSNADESDIRQQLIALEKIARDKGYALGVIQPYPVTFNAVKAWAENLENRGVRLVPLPTLLQEVPGGQR